MQAKHALIAFFLVCLCMACEQPANYSTLTVGESRPIAPDFIGYNGNLTSIDRPWSQPELVGAFKQLHPGTLRYPAGTLGNYWDWDKGWIASDVPDSLMIKWVVQQNLPDSPRRYTLENLAEMYNQTGAGVVFMLNMLTRDLDHALRNLRRAEALGIPIEYIELGNEFYYNLPLETSRYPTPEDYGREANRWMEALREVYPDAKYAVVAGGPRRSPRHERWDERVLSEAPTSDAITIHIYTPSGIYEADTTGVDEQTHHLRLLEKLTDGPAYTQFIATAFEAANRWQGHPLPDGGEIWITEWNLRADNDPVRGTWANTLFATVFYHTFLDSDVVTMAHYHNLVGSLFEAVFTDTEGYSHVKVVDLDIEPWTVAAGGFAGQAFGAVMTGRTRATRLVMDEVPVLEVSEASHPAFLGWVFGVDDAYESAILINLGSEPLDVQLPGEVGLPEATYRQYSAALDTYVTGHAALHETSGSWEGSLHVPAYSITTIHASSSVP